MSVAIMNKLGLVVPKNKEKASESSSCVAGHKRLSEDLLRAPDGTAPARAHLVLAAGGRLGGGVAVRLALAPEEVVVRPILVDGGRLGVVVPRGLVLDVGGGRLGDGERLGAQGHLVEVVPVGAEGEDVGAVVGLVDRRVDGVVGRAVGRGEADGAVVRPGALLEGVARRGADAEARGRGGRLDVSRGSEVV